MIKTTPATAAARHVMLGTDDQSTRLVTPEAKAVAQHVPLFYLNTVKGDYERRHIVNSELIPLYGIETVVPTSKFFNKFSIFAKELLPYTTAVIQRAKGKVFDAVVDGKNTYRDANTASLVIYMATTVDTQTEKAYIRDASTNAVVRDENGNPTYTADDIDVNYSGLVAKVVPNSMAGVSHTVTINGVDINLTPIKTLRAEGHGSFYNNIGFNIEPFINLDRNKDINEKYKTLTYGFTLFDKHLGTPKILKTVSVEDTVEFTLNEEAVVPITNKPLFLDARVPSEYGNYTDPLYVLQSYTLDKDKSLEVAPIERKTLENRLTAILETEITKTGIDGTGANLTLATWVDYGLLDGVTAEDVTKVADEYKHLVNFVTCVNTNGIDYETIRPFPSSFFGIDPTVTFVPVSDSAITYLGGGEDSDAIYQADNEALELGLVEEIARYSDANDIVQSIPLNHETIFYDPGLTLANKIKLGAFISKKTNTLLGMSTHVTGEAPVSIATHISRAEAIKGILKLNTESAYYNTPTARAFIVMGSGLISNDSYRPTIPLLLDYATKIAKYTGALNGEWKGTENFYGQDGSIIRTMKDISPKFIPDTIKDKLHTSGVIWPDNEDTLTFFYPTNQTIYENDTSVLNSVITMIAICTLNTINEAIWRKYSGRQNLSNLDLKMAVENDVRERTANLFDGNFVISPEVYYTQRDEQLGWLWRLAVTLYSNVSKTVMVSHIIVKRLSDLDG